MTDWDMAETQFARALRWRLRCMRFCDWLCKMLTGADRSYLERYRMHKLGL